MPSTFVYTNAAAAFEEFEPEIRAFDAAGLVVDVRQAWWERCAVSVDALDRPQLRRMLYLLCPGDTVMMLRLASVGRSVGDVLATIDRLRALDVGLFCVELGEFNLTARELTAPMRTLLAVGRLERQSRSARMKESAISATARGHRLGRRPAVAETSQDDIRQALHRGVSVSELARAFHVSRQTIMRIRERGQSPVDE